MKRSRTDVFLSSSDVEVEFVRGDDGEVIGYRENNLAAAAHNEYFYEFDRDTPHQQRSATKTLMALLAGAAVDSGHISSVDEKVLPYFDQYADLNNVDDRKRALGIRDLLSMQSGFDCNDWEQSSLGNESKMVQTDDWARFILDLPMAAAPGTRGAYCSGNVLLVGKIIEQALGMPLNVETAKPFRWTASANAIIAATNRAKQHAAA